MAGPGQNFGEQGPGNQRSQLIRKEDAWKKETKSAEKEKGEKGTLPKEFRKSFSEIQTITGTA